MTSFVILHYKNIQDTLECIASIQKQKGEYSIIVVDNGTLTTSEKEKLIDVVPDIICNEDNLGFAKGNNIGCTYATLHYHPDYLVVLNNDIVLQGDDFILKIEKAYNKVKFDFMGPKIITDGGESVNPFPVYRTLDEVEQAISTSKKLICIYHSVILTFLLNSYISLKRMVCKPRHLENGEKSCRDIAVHGCCIVFSKKYYERYDNIFYPGTFLYHEEEFLDYRRKKDGLISYYDSSITVFHKEGASLNLSFQNKERKKLIFRNREIVRSLGLLKKIMLEDGSI